MKFKYLSPLIILVFCLQSSIFSQPKRIDIAPTDGALPTSFANVMSTVQNENTNERYWIAYNLDAQLPARISFFSDGNSSIYSSGKYRIESDEIYLSKFLNIVDENAAYENDRHDGDYFSKHSPKVTRQVCVLFQYSASANSPSDYIKALVQTVNVPLYNTKGNVYYLGKKESEASAKFLIELYQKTSKTKFKSQLIRLIGFHKAPELIEPFLTDILNNDKKSELRKRAAELLGKQNTATALITLLNTEKNDENENVRKNAVEAIGDMTIPGAEKALVNFINTSQSQQIQRQAVESLGGFQTESAIKTLKKIVYENRNERIQREAVEAFRGSVLPETVSFLKKVVEDHPNTKVRSEAIEVLVELQFNDKLQYFENTVFSNDSERLQRDATEVLNRIKDRKSKDVLIRIYKEHPNLKIRKQAIESISQMAASNAVELLGETIEENDTPMELRKSALYALAELPNDEGIPKLIDIAKNSKNMQLRKRAIQILGDSNSREAHEAIITIVKSM